MITVKKIKPLEGVKCPSCKPDADPPEVLFEITYWGRERHRTNLRFCRDCLNTLAIAIHNAQLNDAIIKPETNPGAPPVRDWGELTKPDRDPSFIQAKTRLAASPGITPLPGEDFLRAIARGDLPESCPKCGRPIEAKPAKAGPNIELSCSGCGWNSRIIKSGEGA
jgi:hypothetical protein